MKVNKESFVLISNFNNFTVDFVIACTVCGPSLALVDFFFLFFLNLA